MVLGWIPFNQFGYGKHVQNLLEILFECLFLNARAITFQKLVFPIKV